ncbi:MAG: hypothetical protein J7K87_00565 [Candidatus Aenigmarchaeota archaeon]|nr:hypothetical protein [Candidatus Aenigmarchaeota archaeon]
MFRLIFSPKWFYGIDIIFEIFFVLITLLISFYGYKIYNLSRNKEHKYFSISFLLIATSFIFKILTNFDIYFNVFRTLRIGFHTIVLSYLYNSGILYVSGLFIYKFLTTLAFFGLFLLTTKKHSKNDIYLIIYLILISTIFSSFAYYIFHITLAIILFFLCTHLYDNYKKRKSASKFLVLLAFLMILASQFAFMIIFLAMEFYVVGEIFLLIGYFILLYNYLMVSRK